MRSISQLLSYECYIGLIVINIMIINNSLSLYNITYNQIYIVNSLYMVPIVIISWIAILAETNRHPFDLPEAESELVAGFNTEYSGLVFALIYLAEYGNIISMSLLSNVLFFKG